MSKSILARSAVLLLLALVPIPVRADEAGNWMRLKMMGYMYKHITWDHMWTVVLEHYQASNPDERGVTREGVEQLRQVLLARWRALGTVMLRGSDLDGDGQITRTELMTSFLSDARALKDSGVPTRRQVQDEVERLVEEKMKADANGDGILQPIEIHRSADALIPPREPRPDVVPFFLDLNKDAAVSLSEYESIARSAFNSIDTDGDGRISLDEAAAFRKTRDALSKAVADDERARAGRPR